MYNTQTQTYTHALSLSITDYLSLTCVSVAVYVTTASNPTESSYACYMDEKLKTYLGDCYSVNWMEDVDKVCVCVCVCVRARVCVRVCECSLVVM